MRSLRCGRDAQLDGGIDVFKHRLCLVGGIRPEHVLLVDHCDDGQTEFLLCAPGDFIERSGAFAVAHHQVFLLVDALPVDEKNLAGLYALVLVEFVKHNRGEFAGFAKSTFEAHVALEVKFPWREPDEGTLLETAVAACAQFVDDIGERLAGHDGFAGSCRGLEDNLSARAAEVKQLDCLVGQIADSVLLVFQRFHSSPPFGSAANSPPISSSVVYSPVCLADAPWRVPTVRLGNIRLYVL